MFVMDIKQKLAVKVLRSNVFVAVFNLNLSELMNCKARESFVP